MVCGQVVNIRRRQ